MTDDASAEGSYSRLDKPLGRGLEDISHLFQLGRPREATANEHPSVTSSPAGAVLLKRQLSLTRDQLAPLLNEFHGALEEGLTSIDSEIACPPCGPIDLLGLSRSSQLTIIDFTPNIDEGLLIRGLGHLDWVARNMLIVRRLYPNHRIDSSLSPALILVAPQFSPALRSAARHLRCLPIKWVRYRALESSMGLGIFFECLEEE